MIDVTTLATGGNGAAASPWTGWVSPANSATGALYFPAGHYRVGDAERLTPASGQVLLGDGHDSVIGKLSSATAPVISVGAVSDVTIRDLTVSCGSTSSQNGNIELDGASLVRILGVVSKDGYAGVWAKECSQVSIIDCDIYNCSHNVYLGGNTAQMGGPVHRVKICQSRIHDAKTGGDGIKTIKQCEHILISGNDIYDNAADGIDLFACGNAVIVEGNEIYGNGVNGIDMKSDATSYPPATWGQKTSRVIVANNQIGENGATGVSIWKVAGDDYLLDVVVSGNDIYGNQTYGVICKGNRWSIKDNMIHGNCLSSASNYAAVYILGLAAGAGPVVGGTLSGNIVCNNGVSGKSNSGVLLSETERVAICGNYVANVSADPGAEQNFYGIALMDAACKDIRFVANVVHGHAQADFYAHGSATWIGCGNYPSSMNT